ncbi:hypothetical protein DW322_14175 [Rhodococcus rhodnii]|uniref:Uncharacterized protein n=2 Tax=Rhodococcus rhodnii TaxID=38312 RepID=R7WIK4_9NOCA|nr:hypothetical protein [Rhodococcus rhodnii]EOM75057.1 hypothetical protein Rrhod_3670 [Rhodococcus rhodnii LMG 5362]TXG91154.1 hypothetical protein DW322_14175 [Rhodococcus rhodnii]
MSNQYGDDPTRAYGRGYDPRYADGAGYPGQGQQPYRGEPYPPQGPRRPRIETGPFAAGIAATVLVAAIAGWVLTAVLQALFNRFEWGSVWAYGLVDPWTAAITGGFAALCSGLLMWLLAQGVPSPGTFYTWSATLVVIAVVVLPFIAAQTWPAAIGAGVVHGFIGAVVISLTKVVAARTVHE